MRERFFSGGALLLAAQILSSLGNLVLAALVGRASNVTEFGAFALALAAYPVFQRFVRVILLIPRQIQAQRTDGEGRASETIGASFYAGLFVACGLALIASLLSSALGPWLLVFAATFPGLACYDAVRNEFIAKRRLHPVFGLDLGWLAGQAALSGVVAFYGWSPLFYVLVWGAVPTVLGASTAFRFGRWWSHVQVHKSVTRLSGADGAVDLASSLTLNQMFPYFLAATFSLGALAGFRGAQILVGPVNILVTSLTPLLQIYAAQNAHSPRRLRRSMWAASLILGAVSAGALGFGMVSERIGEALLGASWAHTVILLPAVVAHLVLRIPVMMVQVVLRSVERGRALLALRVTSVLAQVMGGLAGAVVDGVSGAVWGLAIGAGAASMASIVVLRSQVQQVQSFARE